MTGRVRHHPMLTNADLRLGGFLTLICLTFLISTFSHADPLPAVEDAAVKQRLEEASRYIRKQGLQTLSVLPDQARQVMRWFSDGLHPMQWMGDSAESESPTPETLTTALQSPLVDQSSYDFVAGFHHKGFLPGRDAVLLGVTGQKNMLADKMQFTAHPYLGQSWHSARQYWGGEVAMGLAHRSDGLPWGKIAVNYVGGDQDLTDHGRGLDMHGDVDLTRGFQFTSGVRKNNTDGNSQYLLVRWKLTLGDNP